MNWLIYGVVWIRFEHVCMQDEGWKWRLGWIYQISRHSNSLDLKSFDSIPSFFNSNLPRQLQTCSSAAIFPKEKLLFAQRTKRKFTFRKKKEEKSKLPPTTDWSSKEDITSVRKNWMQHHHRKFSMQGYTRGGQTFVCNREFASEPLYFTFAPAPGQTRGV